jgi:hypothetical protein
MDITLFQNHPNPFNASTIIKFSLKFPSHIKLNVYNILGAEVQTLINENKSAGSHQISFDAKNLPSGIYIYQIQSVTQTITKQMILKN